MPRQSAPEDFLEGEERVIGKRVDVGRKVVSSIAHWCSPLGEVRPDGDCRPLARPHCRGAITAGGKCIFRPSIRRLRSPVPRYPVHLVVDGLPAHKTKLVKDYVQSTKGRLNLHFLPGYAPDLNPDELSHVKRTGAARTPLRKGEHLRDKIEAQLAKIKTLPRLVRSFFQAPSVAYITDC